MEFGPDEGSSAPPLPEALRVKIPRSSLGKLGALGGIQNWTSTATDCCNIGDMDVGDDVDIDDEEGVRAEALAQEDVQVAAANLG